MSQSILLTGPNTEATEINVLWVDRNNIRNGAVVEISVERGDNDSRTLHVSVNGVIVAVVYTGEKSRAMAGEIAKLAGTR